MTRILFLDPADFVGGAELFMVDLIKNLPKDRFEIFLVTSGQKAYLDLLPTGKCQVRILSFPRLKPINFRTLVNLFKTARGLKKIINEIKPDVIQSNSVRSHIVGALAAKKSRRKIIWYFHDYTFPGFILRRLIKIPARVLTNSRGVLEAVKKQVAKKYHGKIGVLPNGINLEKINSVETQNLSGEASAKTDFASLQDELHLSPDVKIIGMVGRIDTWKGQDCFIKAAARLIASYPRARFVILGDANAHDQKTQDYKKYLENLVSELNLRNIVYFLGWRPKVYNMMREFSILVHASTEVEPFGRVVLEGMALGIPVIASHLGGPTEIIKSGENGFLSDPKNTEDLSRVMLRLLEDKELNQKIAAAGLKTAREEYDLRKIVKRWEGIWEKIIRNS